MPQDPRERRRWLDDPRHVDLLFHALVVACGVLVLLDAVVHRTIHESFEGLFGFYALFGFVGYVVLVMTAKQLRRVLKRDEDYYERDRE